jgi:DNA-binding CsgD family transcriptional regulator
MNEPIDLLRCHFGLTPAEARLALHLVAGETLRSAEVKLSISYETARTSLKNIFRKTGTCRQAELVVVIVTALPDCLKQLVTSDSNAGWGRQAMTLQKAKSIARRLGLTLREVCSGDYRVNFRDGNEITAYYTDNLEDAVNTAVEMTRKRPSAPWYQKVTAGGAPLLGDLRRRPELARGLDRILLIRPAWSAWHRYAHGKQARIAE